MHLATLFLAAVAATTATLVAAQNANYTLPPNLPPWYTADFVEWTAVTNTPPPYVDGMPPGTPDTKQLYKTNGKTFYDSTLGPKGYMIEERFEYCVNIFQFSNNFSCTFLNVENVAYLLSSNWRNPEKKAHLPPCCLFSKNFHPPVPSFLRNTTTSGATIKQTNVPWSGRFPTDKATWFILNDIAPPTGPFYYAFTEDRSFPSVVLPTTAVFDAFSFPGMPIAGGNTWIQQNFFKQEWKKPKAEHWLVPQECQPLDKLPNCGFFEGAEMAEKLYSSRYV